MVLLPEPMYEESDKVKYFQDTDLFVSWFINNSICLNILNYLE